MYPLIIPQNQPKQQSRAITIGLSQSGHIWPHHYAISKEDKNRQRDVVGGSKWGMKVQDDGQPLSWKYTKTCISITYWPVCTKYLVCRYIGHTRVTEGQYSTFGNSQWR